MISKYNGISQIIYLIAAESCYGIPGGYNQHDSSGSSDSPQYRFSCWENDGNDESDVKCPYQCMKREDGINSKFIYR